MNAKKIISYLKTLKYYKMSILNFVSYLPKFTYFKVVNIRLTFFLIYTFCYCLSINKLKVNI